MTMLGKGQSSVGLEDLHRAMVSLLPPTGLNRLKRPCFGRSMPDTFSAWNTSAYLQAWH